MRTDTIRAVVGKLARQREHRDHAATARALAWWDELQQLRKEIGNDR